MACPHTTKSEGAHVVPFQGRPATSDGTEVATAVTNAVANAVFNVAANGQAVLRLTVTPEQLDAMRVGASDELQRAKVATWMLWPTWY